MSLRFARLSPTLVIAAFLGACASPERPVDGAYTVVSEAPADAGQEALRIIETRPGVTVRMLLTRPENPAASVVLFAGGHGRLGLDLSGQMAWGRGNFLVRSRRLFPRHGLAVATVDAPSDRQGANGMRYGFRGGADHGRDIAAIVRYLGDRFQRPVWLIGTSRGSASAANGGIRLTKPSALGGIVLSSTVTVANSKGVNVLDMDLDAIRKPVLIAHHRRDGCRVTPFANTGKLTQALENAASTVLLAYSGGRAGRNPCEGRSHHGFLGIENRVVRDIAAWIKDGGQKKGPSRGAATAQ